MNNITSASTVAQGDWQFYLRPMWWYQPELTTSGYNSYINLTASNYPQPIRQGWQCPVCRKVHAPHVNECDCHKRRIVGGVTSGVLPIADYPPVESASLDGQGNPVEPKEAE
jgi:hypothetical protein